MPTTPVEPRDRIRMIRAEPHGLDRMESGLAWAAVFVLLAGIAVTIGATLMG